MKKDSAKMTPGKAIRAYCSNCVGGNPRDVTTCDGIDCPFHPYRLGTGRPSVKTIRRFCLDCMGGHINFVRECSITECLCHLYRFGKSLSRKSGRSAEWMQEIRSRRQNKSKQIVFDFKQNPSPLVSNL